MNGRCVGEGKMRLIEWRKEEKWAILKGMEKREKQEGKYDIKGGDVNGRKRGNLRGKRRMDGLKEKKWGTNRKEKRKTGGKTALT